MEEVKWIYGGGETTTTRRIEKSPDTFHNFGFLVGKRVVDMGNTAPERRTSTRNANIHSAAGQAQHPERASSIDDENNQRCTAPPGAALRRGRGRSNRGARARSKARGPQGSNCIGSNHFGSCARRNVQAAWARLPRPDAYIEHQVRGSGSACGYH